jgi:hypothetical protein
MTHLFLTGYALRECAPEAREHLSQALDIARTMQSRGTLTPTYLLCVVNIRRPTRPDSRAGGTKAESTVAAGGAERCSAAGRGDARAFLGLPGSFM